MAIIEALKNLMRRVPVVVWLAVGGLLAGAFWLLQHDARIRRQVGLQQLRSETAAEVAALRKQAAQEVEKANVENAKAVAKLEQRRQQAEQQNRRLAAQLDRLRKQAQVQAGEVATLPISEIVTRVAAQLGLNSGDVLPAPSSADAEGKLQITNDELQNSEAMAGPTARNRRLCVLCGPQALAQRAQRSSVSSVLEPFNPQRAQRGRGKEIMNYELQKPAAEATQAADIKKDAISAPADKKRNTGILRGVYPEPLHSVQGRSQVEGERAQDDKQRTQDDRNAALALTASGARKVEAALVQLNACRAESNIENQQLSNCQGRAEADEAAIERLNGSVASLNQAIAAKDKIFARQQTQYKAELRAARGTFLGRLARLTEHVAIGVGVGVVIGMAVK